MLTADGKKYDVADGVCISTGINLEGRMVFGTRPATFRQVNVCPHCHRSDRQKVVAHSVEEAVAFGWLVPVLQSEVDDE